VADGLPTRPVVIGHSLGGFIVQKYLESHQAPAGVLLASLPPRGIGGFLWRNAKRHPLQAVRATLTTKTLRNYRTPALVREAFYSSATPESDVVRYGARLCEEYTGRVTLDTLILNRPEPERVTSPVLVLGAEADHCITPAEVDATARAYRTIAELFPWMGHNMMLEPDWPKVAGTIHNWLTAHGI
ncbi:alpha/beta fold hydrolase, partial [Mycolicibacterium sp. CBMA 361]